MDTTDSSLAVCHALNRKRDLRDTLQLTTCCRLLQEKLIHSHSLIS